MSHTPQFTSGNEHSADATQAFSNTYAPQADISLLDNVQPGLNLYLPLKNPMQMAALAQTLEDNKAATQHALSSLHYVHFARFLPSRDYSALWVITVFDGAYGVANDPGPYADSLQSYLMDFVATMGDIFTAILDFVEGAPRLPVHEYPRDFIEYVTAQNNAQVNPWSAYPQLTVIDIQTSHGLA